MTPGLVRTRAKRMHLPLRYKKRAAKERLYALMYPKEPTT